MEGDGVRCPSFDPASLEVMAGTVSNLQDALAGSALVDFNELATALASKSSGSKLAELAAGLTGRDIAKRFDEFSRGLQIVTRDAAIADVSGIAARAFAKFDGLALSAKLTGFASSAAFEEFRESLLAQDSRIAELLEHLSPLLQGEQIPLVEKPDDRPGRLTLRSATVAITEVVSGFDLKYSTPVDKFKFWFHVLLILIHLLEAANDSYNRELERALDHADHLAIERAQAHTIAELTQMVVSLKQQAVTDEAAILKISKRAIVREGPSPNSPRILTLAPGHLVITLARWSSWHYVEVLPGGACKGSGVRGWIYNRNMGRAVEQ